MKVAVVSPGRAPKISFPYNDHYDAFICTFPACAPRATSDTRDLSGADRYKFGVCKTIKKLKNIVFILQKFHSTLKNDNFYTTLVSIATADF